MQKVGEGGHMDKCEVLRLESIVAEVLQGK